jgi:chromosomal replication initiation ATPase DnaA
VGVIALGGRDHSTVMHALDKIEDLIRDDHAFADKVKRIKSGVLTRA